MKRFLKSLELFSRNAIIYPLLNLLLKRKPIDQKVDINQIKKILIFRHDRIGDMIVTTPIFRKLKRANPSLFIGVTASPANAEIIQENRNVDKIYVLHKGIISRLRMILKMRSENYNVILNFVFTSTSWGALMSALISSKAIRVGHGLEKHKSYYDKFLILDRLKYHMVESLSEFLLQVFCIEMQQSEYVYEIPISQTARINVERFLHHHKLCKRDERIPNRSEYAVINISANEVDRRISFEQIKVIVETILEELQKSIVIIFDPKDKDMMQRCSQTLPESNVFTFYPGKENSLFELAFLIEDALFVVTPDTSIVHFASAVRTPILAFYNQQQKMSEWYPVGIEHKLVFTGEGKPVSQFPNDKIVEALRTFIEMLK